jgi:hypothetical protein
MILCSKCRQKKDESEFERHGRTYRTCGTCRRKARAYMRKRKQRGGGNGAAPAPAPAGDLVLLEEMDDELTIEWWEQQGLPKETLTVQRARLRARDAERGAQWWQIR